MAITIDRRSLPALFPTHKHTPDFWEALGRAVATFGVLEEVLGRAIFALTATKEVAEEEAEEEVAKWITRLERALDDPLGKLIDSYEKALRDRTDAALLGDLAPWFTNIREACVLRNVLCHASWQLPDAEGRSKPRYVDKRRGACEAEVDLAFLQQTQRHVAELVCDVIESVTLLGLNFPGIGNVVARKTG